MSDPHVETVLGPVALSGLGIIMPHEHFPSFRGISEALEPPAGYLLQFERIQREAIREAQSHGVGTIVEVTPIGMMRCVPMMQRLSRDTGINVVASTGFYLEGRRPQWVKDKSAEELADLFVRELTETMTGADAKAWMIKVAGNDPGQSEEDRKVFRAAALASLATGAAITTHSCSSVRSHFDLLVEAGADPARLYLGHADLAKDDQECQHVAVAGGHLIFTCWGIQHFVDQDALAMRVVRLVEGGFGNAVLMSIDYSLVVADNRMDIMSTEYECPRRTPAFLFRYAIPKLREKGISDELIRTFIVDNPRVMLRRPAPSAPGKLCARVIAIRTGLELRPFGPATEGDAVHLINAYTAGWPYCRPVGDELLAHWRTLRGSFQPENMLVAYRDGLPRAFLHGEAAGKQHFAHLLAMAPGAVEEGVWLLGQAEVRARAAGVGRLCGPTCQSGRFYGGYLLGLEPYHPHWASDGTEAFVRAGFSISQSEVLMAADLSHGAAHAQVPLDYAIVEADADPEFEARPFRLAAVSGGREVATCGGRLYPHLRAPAGGVIGQLGPVRSEEAHRGRGLATALVKLALKHLCQWGASEALISTGLDNAPALRAYERAGFKRRHSLTEWSKPIT